jgi:hypothetical protein
LYFYGDEEDTERLRLGERKIMGDVIPQWRSCFLNHVKYDCGLGRHSRNGEELPEITTIRQAVREWPAFDSDLDGHARLKFARPIILDGASVAALTGGAIVSLVRILDDGYAERQMSGASAPDLRQRPNGSMSFVT